MTRPPQPPPYFFATLYAILYATGAALIAVALPLYRGRVPRNSLYGVRFAATLADDRIWYPINARGGRDLIAIAIIYLAVTTFTLLFGSHWPILPRILGPVAFVGAALIVETFVLWRAASRLAKERCIHHNQRSSKS